MSNVFGLEQARSLEAERAIESAERYMRGAGKENPSGLQTREGDSRAALPAAG